MKLHEYQSKQIFSKYGIPIPKGRVAATAAEAKAIAEELGGRVVVKAQVLVGGRGKAGGVQAGQGPGRSRAAGRPRFWRWRSRACPSAKCWWMKPPRSRRRSTSPSPTIAPPRKPVMIASAAGGVEIEEVAAKTPEKIIKVHIDPLLGLRDYQARDIAASIDLPRDYWKDFGEIAAGSVAGLHGERRHPGRDQSAGDHQGQAAGGAGWQDADRRQRPLPPSRPGRDARHRRGSARPRPKRASTACRTSSWTATSAAWSTAPAWP